MKEKILVLGGWLQESCLLLLYLLSGIVGYVVGLQTTKDSKNGVTIVFVHGWLTQNPIYYFLKRYLEGRGYSVHMTNFGLHTGDYYELSRALKDYIETQDLRDVILVGASGGAIISFLYLQELDGWQYVRRFISVGGPLRGSPLAFLGFFSTAARQMVPNSTFMRNLHSSAIKHPERIVCLFTTSDELVPVWSSQVLGAVHVRIEVIGHVRLQTTARETFSVIAQYAVDT